MSNKLIAEFMELETKTFKSGILNYYYQDVFEGNWFEEGELSYNLSWDWLMPVVSKCAILNNEEGFEPFKDICEMNIDDTYKAVVEFIIATR